MYFPSVLEKLDARNPAKASQSKQYSSTVDVEKTFNIFKSDHNLMYYIHESYLLKFNLITQTFMKKKLEFPYTQYSYVRTQDYKIVACGGIDCYKKNVVSHCYEIDCNSKKIQPMENMINARFDHTLACVDGVVYAFGGRGINGIPLKSCEKYSFDGIQWNWQMIAQMNFARTCPATATAKSTRCIYVFGNPFFKEQSIILEKYIIQDNKWEIIKIEMPPYSTLRNYFLGDPHCKIAINDSTNYQLKQ